MFSTQMCKCFPRDPSPHAPDLNSLMNFKESGLFLFQVQGACQPPMTTCPCCRTCPRCLPADVRSVGHADETSLPARHPRSTTPRALLVAGVPGLLASVTLPHPIPSPVACRTTGDKGLAPVHARLTPPIHNAWPVARRSPLVLVHTCARAQARQLAGWPCSIEEQMEAWRCRLLLSRARGGA